MTNKTKIIKIVIPILVIIIVIFLYSLLTPWLFWISSSEKGWECNGEKHIGFALGFWHNGEIIEKVPSPVNQAVIEAGKANERLANWLYDNANCFSEIYTQRAISDVWIINNTLEYPNQNPTEDDYGILKGTGVKVYQMHKHNPKMAPVRTFEALRCALDRLDNRQGEDIVLTAHHGHYKRAFKNLSSMYNPENIVNPFITKVPYPESTGPICWAVWNSIANATDLLLGETKCRQGIALSKVK